MFCGVGIVLVPDVAVLCGVCVLCGVGIMPWFAAQNMLLIVLAVFGSNVYCTLGKPFLCIPWSNLFWNTPGLEFSSNNASNIMVDVICC